jgi:hypothetical protein
LRSADFENEGATAAVIKSPEDLALP